MDSQLPATAEPSVEEITNPTFDERVTVGPRTRWFWDPLACEHISRYLLARSWVNGRVIVDVGCGSGYGAALLARDGRRLVMGIDVSRHAIEMAAAAWPRANLMFKVGDALDLDAAPGSADSVVSFETIEHVADPARFLDQIAHLLRVGGRLVLSTPDRTHYSPGSGPGESHNPFHPSEMTRSELLELIRMRFRVIAVYGQGRVDPSMMTGMQSHRPIRSAIKRATDPMVGRGRLAEALLPLVRRHHVPRLIDSAGYKYIVVVCEKVAGPPGRGSAWNDTARQVTAPECYL